jgi:hypothetical protein
MMGQIRFFGKYLGKFGNLPKYLGKFGTPKLGTEQEPNCFGSVFFGSVFGTFRFGFGSRYFVPSLNRDPQH